MPHSAPPQEILKNASKIINNAICKDLIGDPESWNDYSNYICQEMNAMVGMAITVRDLEPAMSLHDFLSLTWQGVALGDVHRLETDFHDELTMLNRRAYENRGKAKTLRETMSPEELRKSPVMNEFVVPAGLENYICATVRLRPGKLLYMGLHFEHEHDLTRGTSLARLIVPELLEDLRVAAKHRLMVRKLNLAEKTLNQIRMSIILLDRERRVMNCNTQAEDLLRKGVHLRLGNGKLVAFRPEDTVGIRRVFDLLRRSGALYRNANVVVRDSSGVPLQLSFIQLSASVRSALGERSAFVGVFANIPDQRGGKTIELNHMFRSVYSMSVSQAKVATLFANGHAESEIAEFLKISRETVRTHLAQAGSKARGLTGSDESRKSLLVRLGEQANAKLLV